MELLGLFLLVAFVVMAWSVRQIAITARDRIMAAEAQARQIAARLEAPDDYRIMTVTIPDGGGVLTWQPMGDPCRLEECPPGPFMFRGELCIKSKFDQYGSTDLHGETVVIWDRTRDLLVQPVAITDGDPDPFWVEP